MFARTTTLTARQPGIDRGIRYVQDEVMPALQAVDGFVGLSTLVDHATGRCIITTSWQTAGEARAGEPRVRPILDRCVAAFDGADSTVDEWEVAIMHRVHTSDTAACARVSWLEGDPDTMGDLIDAFRAAVPKVELLPGFGSASLLVDRRGGRAVSTVAFDSQAAMAKSRAQATELRSRVADSTGAYVCEIAEFELVVSQLRVPELV
jgi:heme-degrading monooxygenase HmoA